jgi:hypothetical protein
MPHSNLRGLPIQCIHAKPLTALAVISSQEPTFPVSRLGYYFACSLFSLRSIFKTRCDKMPQEPRGSFY